MIIVSQDRAVIVNFNNVENVWINNPLENTEGKFEIITESYSNNRLMGEYDTEERAKEVLKEIMKEYGKCNRFGPGFVSNEVFYMPEK